ncbi:Piso0_003172 [Millerozyma farinosa CBS 7064]|uniref:Piso0_003172 protein n=1 Tax=Pichia sorbitophila (strain ATCC MYA-4447 / BCRC 22081 / CBS 7064 / NBRC 10061 / NRRL Y-12695) TaxID=559304 RepID=G8YKJ4_PICSO|nr:Piso0_003172 [Millerozyma farinosa CBS 7064]CCE80839.1 Piso0_003172 [Millerozyma farinosa CBS 7064]
MSKREASPLDTNTAQTLSDNQNEILTELQLILKTVESIDENIKKAIALLLEPQSGASESYSLNSTDESKSRTYSQLVETNTGRIKEILSALDGL